MVKVRPKKRLGQHFLVDERILRDILSAAELNPTDVVVEVGAGLGILTKELAKQAAKVITIEIDTKLISTLKRNVSSFSNVNIIHGDILKIPPEQLLEVASELTPRTEGKELECRPHCAQSYKVVANLPYYITSPVLRHFLEASAKPSMMVVMVQKEVGEAIVATPGKMSLLSLRTQFYSKPIIIAHVLAESFSPPPMIDSVILRLDVYPKPPIEVSEITGFFDIIIRGFSSPRKQLRNSLAQDLEIPPSQVALLLEETGVEAKRRAETLSLEEWKKVWKTFAPFTKCKKR